MSLIMDALDAPAARLSNVICLSDSTSPLTASELSDRARAASTWMHHLCGPGGTVAALLTASHDCLAAIFGALRAGLTLVSLPTPARGMKPEEYIEQIDHMCALAGATHLLTDAEYVPLLGAVTIPVHGFHEYSTLQGEPPGAEPGRFVQFTSGSTGAPRGIELSLQALEANVTSMYDWLVPRPDAVTCNWLPLSHDMGLVGFVLTSLLCLAPPWSNQCDMVLLKPETFLSDPARWLQACTDYRATSTAAPPFALRMAGRVMRPGSGHSFDLSTLRSFVVGSEPVPPQGLRDFESLAQRHGLPANALCPGYGLAETSLAVAIGSISAPWTSVRLDADALNDREWREDDAGDVELVSCGQPLLNVEVRIPTGDGVGNLQIKSPSLLSGYVGEPRSPVSPDGWLATADLGHLGGGELFIAGRSDDIFIIAGRNIDARALDEVAGAHPACRPGNAAAVADGEGRYVVIVEPSATDVDASDLRRSAREIRVALSRRFAAAPSAVIFIERGTLPKTPSGKVRRNHLQTLWRAGELPTVVAG
jgi:acyl-CoA synthetase (AMP-forming)/AMP-acid ligase II